VIIDLGTGDGRAALTLAETEPRTLVIGIDADAASMAETSRRAARPSAKGGRPNLLFVAAAAEAPPPELLGLAGEIRILFPWGSLLHGVLGADERVALGIAGLARSGGRVSAIVSVTPRDGLGGITSLDPAGIAGIADATRRSGLRLTATRRLNVDEVRATRSTWGRRLLGGAADRPVWRIEFVNEALSTEPDAGRVREPAV
jgi:16S rRNA (adenine(1408)-N(1))-methyltransferase